MALSQAAMHPGISFPVAPPVIEDPPLVAMTSPWLSTNVKGPGTAPLVGACATAPLVVVLGSRSPVAPGPIMVAVAATGAVLVEVAFGKISVPVGMVAAGGAASMALVSTSCEPTGVELIEVMSVVVGKLTADAVRSCAAGLD